jgi:hypothetical protein
MKYQRLKNAAVPASRSDKRCAVYGNGARNQAAALRARHRVAASQHQNA